MMHSNNKNSELTLNKKLVEGLLHKLRHDFMRTKKSCLDDARRGESSGYDNALIWDSAINNLEAVIFELGLESDDLIKRREKIEQYRNDNS